MAADGFITDLKRKFQQGDIVLRLVYVNVAVFLVVTLVQIFLTLFNVPASPWMNYLELPAWTETFIRRPWTLITYMFMHAGVLHILFNMLWLFWFGRLFLAFFSSKHLRGLYFLGGICGGLLYMLAYNVFPYFQDAVYSSYLLGASASVLAIVVAVSVREPNYPVQFLFTGKAHPHDGAGQGLIKRIIEISRRPEFLGKIIFLENYDMQLARRLVSGVDIWLNTPTRPLEASGTSGEKALMNGVVNFSVLDGWWLEGYREGAGWALTEKRTYQNQDHQDQLDAATIFSILENEILPLYYARNRKGYSEGWVKTIKNSIAQVAPHYTMKRQLDDYYAKFYTKEAKRFKELVANDYAKAKELAAWKERVAELWDSIEIVSCEKTEELASGNIESGKEYIITYVIDEKGLDDAVGIELVTTFTNAEGKEHIYSVEPMEVIKKEGNLYTFQVKHSLSNSGSFKVAYRMFPKNVDLPHRQDFCYVRWFN